MKPSLPFLVFKSVAVCLTLNEQSSSSSSSLQTCSFPDLSVPPHQSQSVVSAVFSGPTGFTFDSFTKIKRGHQNVTILESASTVSERKHNMIRANMGGIDVTSLPSESMLSSVLEALWTWLPQPDLSDLIPPSAVRSSEQVPLSQDALTAGTAARCGVTEMDRAEMNEERQPVGAPVESWAESHKRAGAHSQTKDTVQKHTHAFFYYHDYSLHTFKFSSLSGRKYVLSKLNGRSDLCCKSQVWLRAFSEENESKTPPVKVKQTQTWGLIQRHDELLTVLVWQHLWATGQACRASTLETTQNFAHLSFGGDL